MVHDIPKSDRIYGPASAAVDATIRASFGKLIMIEDTGDYVGAGIQLIANPSGRGKTPLMNFCKGMIRELQNDKWLITSHLTMPAFIKTVCHTRGTLDKVGQKFEMKDDYREINKSTKETVFVIIDEVEEMIGKLTGRWSKGSSDDFGRFIEMFESGTDPGNEALTSGSMKTYDNCNNLVGFIQPEKFAAEPLDAFAPALRTKGVSARLFYRSGESLGGYDRINTIDDNNIAVINSIQAAHSKLKDSGGSIAAYVKGKSIEDRFRDCEEIQEFKKLRPKLFDSCRPKYAKRAAQHAAVATYLSIYKEIDVIKADSRFAPDTQGSKAFDFDGDNDKSSFYDRIKTQATGDRPDALNRFQIDDEILDNYIRILAADLVNAFIEYNIHQGQVNIETVEKIEEQLLLSNEIWISFSKLWKATDKSKRDKDGVQDALNDLVSKGSVVCSVQQIKHAGPTKVYASVTRVEKEKE